MKLEGVRASNAAEIHLGSYCLITLRIMDITITLRKAIIYFGFIKPSAKVAPATMYVFPESSVL